MRTGETFHRSFDYELFLSCVHRITDSFNIEDIHSIKVKIDGHFVGFGSASAIVDNELNSFAGVYVDRN